jgi:phytoene dehydrogenase-like protein
MKEYAVVGAGIGGASIAAYLDAKGYDTVLFEKEPYLGGCSSTFSHKGFSYNTGATTLAGYQDGHIVKEVFDAIGFTPNIIPTDPAIVIIQGEKVVPRHRDLETFLEALQQHYPHPKNRAFWTLVHTIGQKFYTMHGHYYANRTLLSKAVSLVSYLPLLFTFQSYLRTNAYDFIHAFYKEISPEYLRFLEAQIMIVAQAHSKEINFFTAALSLGYTFNETHYAVGGLSRVFEDMTASMKDVRLNSEIIKIKQHKGHFILYTKNETIETKRLILNSTVYDSQELFEEKPLKQYYKKYAHLQNYQSSFMLYMTIQSDADFAHHYQIIQEKEHPFTLSNALFVSFSDKDDHIISPEGHYSITASIHTDSRWWNNKATYLIQKNELKHALLNTICDTLEIKDTQVIDAFTATPKTFKRYIRRSQLGGNPITMKNFLPKLPGNDTPIPDLFHVGDSVYAAQGWPGVMLGVDNLRKLLHV